jgi:hypothetical protein
VFKQKFPGPDRCYPVMASIAECGCVMASVAQSCFKRSMLPLGDLPASPDRRLPETERNATLVCGAHPLLRQPRSTTGWLGPADPPAVRCLAIVQARNRDLAEVLGSVGRQLVRSDVPSGGLDTADLPSRDARQARAGRPWNTSPGTTAPGCTSHSDTAARGTSKTTTTQRPGM